MTHVKLISWLVVIALVIFAAAGGFGILIAKIVGWALIGGFTLGVYFFIHEVIFFCEGHDNGFS